jgi:hypothetical protein
MTTLVMTLDLVRKRVLKKEVDHLLESAKTHFNEIPEPDVNDLVCCTGFVACATADRKYYH